MGRVPHCRTLRDTRMAHGDAMWCCLTVNGAGDSLGPVNHQVSAPGPL